MESQFNIKVWFQGRYYAYRIELLKITDREEVYKLIARNREIILSNNRPFLKSKGLKHWKPKWTIEDGQIKYSGLQDEIIKALEAKVN